MRILGTADLHLVDDTSAEYRWDIFKTIYIEAQKNRVDAIYICGDITDKKDNHSSSLVNRLMNELHNLSNVAPVMILKGNHDYIKADQPFFQIAEKLGGVTFVSEPTFRGNIALLPHTRTPEETWGDIDFEDIDFVFMHQPVIGAVTSDYYEIEHGLNRNWFSDKDVIVLSGDIHVPQQVGCVEYFGAPYRINFGDNYDGQFLVIDTDNYEEPVALVPISFMKRHTITVGSPEEIRESDALPGDQVKIRIRLAKSAFHEWQQLKREAASICEELRLVVKGIELKPIAPRAKLRVADESDVGTGQGDRSGNPEAVLARFVAKEGLEAKTAKQGITFIQQCSAT